jgi:hypothetical protein
VRSPTGWAARAACRSWPTPASGSVDQELARLAGGKIDPLDPEAGQLVGLVGDDGAELREQDVLGAHAELVPAEHEALSRDVRCELDQGLDPFGPPVEQALAGLLGQDELEVLRRELGVGRVGRTEPLVGDRDAGAAVRPAVPPTLLDLVDRVRRVNTARGGRGLQLFCVEISRPSSRSGTRSRCPAPSNQAQVASVGHRREEGPVAGDLPLDRRPRRHVLAELDVRVVRRLVVRIGREGAGMPTPVSVTSSHGTVGVVVAHGKSSEPSGRSATRPQRVRGGSSRGPPRRRRTAQAC